MSYDCWCDYDNAPEFYHAAISTARKPHRCEECSGRILPGEKYEAVRAKWDGSVSTVKTCQHCVDLRTWVKNNVPCLCIVHGNQDEECQLAIESAVYRAPEETRGLQFGYLRRRVLRNKHNDERRKALP